jgi:hypothetical protein
MTKDVDTEEAQQAHTEISIITRNDVDREEAHTEISAITEFGNTDDTEDHSASESSHLQYAASPTTWQRTQATQDASQDLLADGGNGSIKDASQDLLADGENGSIEEASDQP